MGIITRLLPKRDLNFKQTPFQIYMLSRPSLSLPPMALRRTGLRGSSPLGGIPPFSHYCHAIYSAVTEDSAAQFPQPRTGLLRKLRISRPHRLAFAKKYFFQCRPVIAQHKSTNNCAASYKIQRERETDRERVGKMGDTAAVARVAAALNWREGRGEKI